MLRLELYPLPEPDIQRTRPRLFLSERLPIKKIPVELTIRPFSIALISVRDRTISAAAKRFFDCAREVAGELERRRSVALADEHEQALVVLLPPDDLFANGLERARPAADDNHCNLEC